tara:strand:+ start:572 stop:748 length:177 start_codon:yes stop_codon:yes gene_type:complete
MKVLSVGLVSQSDVPRAMEIGEYAKTVLVEVMRGLGHGSTQHSDREGDVGTCVAGAIE